MKRGQRFITALVIIALLALWFMEGPRLKTAYADMEKERTVAK